MIHLNGNIICAIDTETTGVKPFYNDAIQVCFVPLDHMLEPRKDIVPFDLKILPRRPENIDPAALKVNKLDWARHLNTAINPDVAADMFDEWFDKLNLPEGKRISPLAQNWAFDKPFLQDWLGFENYDYRIDGRYRDTMATALYLNDQAERHSEQIPFPKVNLRYLANCLNIEIEASRLHDAFFDCIVTAQVYREMVKQNAIL